MPTFLNILAALFFFSFFISQGHCGLCTVQDIRIRQQQTGRRVQNKPEWSATIYNDCFCSQADIKLACNGFQTVEPIDSTVLAKSGGECLVNKGKSILFDSGVKFTYAWDTPFQFRPLSSKIPNCPNIYGV